MKRIDSIYRAEDPDENPDLSWLKQTDEEMGAGWEIHAEKRLATYGDDWHMIGVRAVAIIDVQGIRQEISSPGLWGIESDSGLDYILSVWRDELSTLADMLDELGFDRAEILEHAPELATPAA